MPKALRVAVLAAHEVENTKKEKVLYASEELAREDCRRRLKNLRFKPDDNRANFVRQLRGGTKDGKRGGKQSVRLFHDGC